MAIKSTHVLRTIRAGMVESFLNPHADIQEQIACEPEERPCLHLIFLETSIIGPRDEKPRPNLCNIFKSLSAGYSLIPIAK